MGQRSIHNPALLHLTATVLWGNPRLRQCESAGKEENVVEQRARRKATRGPEQQTDPALLR